MFFASGENFFAQRGVLLTVTQKARKSFCYKLNSTMLWSIAPRRDGVPLFDGSVGLTLTLTEGEQRVIRYLFVDVIRRKFTFLPSTDVAVTAVSMVVANESLVPMMTCKQRSDFLLFVEDSIGSTSTESSLRLPAAWS
jgi:hypothetical protein